MAFRRACFTQRDIDRWHPSCIECTKKIKVNVSVVTVGGRTVFQGYNENIELYVHEKCFMKFAGVISDDPHDSTPSIQVKLTEDTVTASKLAVRELANA